MTPTTPTGALNAELRIITAGRTGYENDLRRDETIELIRARTSLDAIGELANPIDELSPSGTALLVGPDALTAEESDEFIEAVRKIAPDARIVLISDSKKGADRFDAVLPVDAGTDALWSALGLSHRQEPVAPLQIAEPPEEHTAQRTDEPEGSIGLLDGIDIDDLDLDDDPGPGDPAPILAPRPITTPMPDPTPKRAPAPKASAPAEIHTRPMRPSTKQGRGDRAAFEFEPADVLDEAMLSVIGEPPTPVDDLSDGEAHDASLDMALSGGDTLRAGLAELRATLGTQTVRFTPGDSAGAGEPVKRGSRLYGALRAEGIDQGKLADSARWLANRIALHEQLAALRQAAFTDELTGAWNRRFFRRFLDRGIERARANRQDLSLMIFDIDDFKSYNDRYGHAAGDEILVEVVRLLVAVVRPSDRVCRIGGDEFAVIFADGPRESSSRHPASIETIARRFQKQICEHRFPKLGSDAMGTLTVSGGLATFPWEAHNSESLMELADQLAMQSKRAGKNIITMGPGASQVCQTLREDEAQGD